MVDFKIWCKNEKEIEVITNVLDQLGVVGLLSGATAKRVMDHLNLNKLGIFVRDGKFTYTTLPETYEKCNDLTEFALFPKTTNAEPTINDFCAAANEMGYHTRIEVRDGDDAVVFSNSSDGDLFYFDWDTREIFLTWCVDDMSFVIIDGYTAQEAVKVVVNEVKNVLKGIVEYYELGGDDAIS